MTDALVNNAGTPRIEVKVPGIQGPPGNVVYANSAYQEWLDAGYVGTVEDFFEFLSGEDGADGDDGETGAAGLSAYDVAVAEGFVGSEAEWLASLVGPAGEDGADGADGADGVPTPHYMTTIPLTGPFNELDLPHDGNLIEITHGSATAYHLTAANDADIPVGAVIHLVQAGAGELSVTWDGVTVLHGASFDPTALEQEAIMVLIKRAAGSYRLGGALKLAGA